MYVFIHKKRIKISTKQRIHPALWDFKKQFVTKSDRVIKKHDDNTGIWEQVLLVKERLNELRNEVHRYSMVCQLQNKSIQLYELRERLYELLDDRKHTPVDRNSIIPYLQTYIDQLESGVRKKPDTTRYSIGTIKNFKNLLQALERYENDRITRLTWDDVDRTFYGNFLEWHLENGCSQNYTGKHVKDFKALMKVAYEEGIHANREFAKRYFIVPYKKQKKVPLSLSEVRRIENMDTYDEPKLSLPKDIFLLGIYLGLRVSDIKRITPSHIHNTKDGLILAITTQKTDTEVRIPINNKAEQILAKYSFKCPYFCEQVVNRHLKLIGKKIGLHADRAKRLTIHVSRHTFAKLSYDMGIPSMYIMAITGHTSEKHFLRYINVQPDEALRAFRSFDFFK
jgi:integrase